jgi:hypothetical protein
MITFLLICALTVILIMYLPIWLMLGLSLLNIIVMIVDGVCNFLQPQHK